MALLAVRWVAAANRYLSEWLQVEVGKTDCFNACKRSPSVRVLGADGKPRALAGMGMQETKKFCFSMVKPTEPTCDCFAAAPHIRAATTCFVLAVRLSPVTARRKAPCAVLLTHHLDATFRACRSRRMHRMSECLKL